MSRIPDYSESELWLIRTTLEERYSKAPEIQLADTEMRLERSSTELVPCPTAYWEVDNCHFVIVKTGDSFSTVSTRCTVPASRNSTT